MKNVIIVGAGEVGIHIAASLVREGHNLVVIEKSPEKVARLRGSMDVLAVCGDGCNPDLLREHNAGNADLFFAVSNSDSVNLLAALTARNLGAASCVVRVADPQLGHNPLVQKDPQIIQLYPENLVAEEIFSLTRVPGVGKARFFAESRLVLLHVRPSIKAAIYGKPLNQIPGPKNWNLTGIHRSSGMLIPRGETVLRPGDLIYAVGPAETIPEFLDSVGVDSRPTRRVVVAGAGQVGSRLAQMLVDEKIEVAVIQRGADRAFNLAAEVPAALVLRGDATDPVMLREAGVSEADYFVAATQDDETNLLSSLLARETGAKAVVALYQKPEFLNLMHAVRIDIPLSPRMMIAGTILRMVHGSEIVSLDLLEGGDAEVVEFEVPKDARVLRRALSRLSFPQSAVVGAVMRGDEIHIPRGDFTFAVGDRALVFTLTEALPELERIFRAR